MIVYYITTVLVFLLCWYVQTREPLREEVLQTGVIKRGSNSKFILFLILSVLVLVAGLRYNVGTDYGAYFRQYQILIDKLNESPFDEPMYGFIALFSKTVGGGGELSILLASLITVGICVVTIFRNTDEIVYAVMLYLFLGCWSVSFNAVRQSLAVAFVFAGYRWLRDRRLLRFAFCVIIAFLCHRSALILILMYFVLHRKINIFNILITILGAFIALQSYDALFSFAGELLEKEYSSGNQYLTNTVNGLRVLAGVAPAAFFVSSTWQQEKTGTETFHLNILILHAALRIVTMNSTYLARMPLYTAPFVALSMAELSKMINTKYRKVAMAVILLLFMIFWFYELSNSSGTNNFMFIWQK